MGYNLEIARIEFGSNWADVEGPAITPEEWLAVVQNDPELTISVLSNSNGLSNPYHADWSGPGNYPCWLDYSDGRLFTKNPTHEMIEKMVQIAKRLGAIVQGDDGEVYLGEGQVTERDDEEEWFLQPRGEKF